MLSNMKLWLVFFLPAFALSSSRTEEGESLADVDKSENCPCETEHYLPEQNHGIIKSPNYPHSRGCNGICVYVIAPHPNKSVSLYTSQYEIPNYSALKIWSIFWVGNELIKIRHATIKRPRLYSFDYNNEEYFPFFVSAINAGYEIHFETRSKDYGANLKMSFDRFYVPDQGELCDNPLVEVTTKETLVQKEHWFSAASGCIYKLRSSDKGLKIDEEDEIIVKIHASEDSVTALRSKGELAEQEESGQERAVKVSAFRSHIISHKSTKTDGMYKLAKITARLVHRECLCGQSNYTFGNNNTEISFHSPGWPNLYCPMASCSYNVSSKAKTDESDNHLFALMAVKITALLDKSDYLVVRSQQKTYFRNDHWRGDYELHDEFFVIKQQTLFVDYQSGKSHTKRNFEVTMRQIMVPLECFCNQYKEKEIKEPLETIVRLGNNCGYIFCHYTFTSTISRRMSLQFQVSGWTDDDLILIKDSQHEERYEGEMLYRQHVYETSDNIELFFYRETNNTKNEPTVVTLKWDESGTGERCEEETVKKVTARQSSNEILVSPGYPRNYADAQICQYSITAEDYCQIYMTVDEISLENFHDYIKIYSGNSTNGQLLHRFTGHILHKVIYFTSSPILLVFQTDQSTSDRGFHISIGAKFDPKLTPPSNIYWKELIGAVGLVLIISILVAGVYTYKQGYWDRWLKKEQTNNGNVERLITTQSDPANGNGNGLTDINPSISRFDSVFN